MDEDAQADLRWVKVAPVSELAPGRGRAFEVDSIPVLLVNDGGAAVLTADQRKNPPVGSGAAVFTEFTAELGHGWRVLGLTDGVWKYVGWDRVIAGLLQ